MTEWKCLVSERAFQFSDRWKAPSKKKQQIGVCFSFMKVFVFVHPRPDWPGSERKVVQKKQGQNVLLRWGLGYSELWSEKARKAIRFHQNCLFSFQSIWYNFWIFCYDFLLFFGLKIITYKLWKPHRCAIFWKLLFTVLRRIISIQWAFLPCKYYINCRVRLCRKHIRHWSST